GGLPLHRDLGPSPGARYEVTGFASLIVRALRRYAASAVQNGHASGSFIKPDLSFGISFNAGDYPSHRDIRVPLQPIARSAMVGALSFFEWLLPATRFLFADGSAAKALVRINRLESFLKEVQASSDAVILVVPQLLRSIALWDWEGPAVTIVIPEGNVHEMWPVVLPYVAGAVHDAISRYRRVTILTQAAAMTAPVGLYLDLMYSNHDTTIRYFDLGQVLNVLVEPDALPPSIRAGFMRWPEAQELARKFSLSRHSRTQ